MIVVGNWIIVPLSLSLSPLVPKMNRITMLFVHYLFVLIKRKRTKKESLPKRGGRRKNWLWVDGMGWNRRKNNCRIDCKASVDNSVQFRRRLEFENLLSFSCLFAISNINLHSVFCIRWWMTSFERHQCAFPELLLFVCCFWCLMFAFSVIYLPPFTSCLCFSALKSMSNSWAR